MNVRWKESSKEIKLFIGNNLVYKNNKDHWNNGFLRLLEISDKEARDYIESIVNDISVNWQNMSIGSKIEQIINRTSVYFNFKNFSKFKSVNKDIEFNKVIAEFSYGDKEFKVIYNSTIKHAILLQDNEIVYETTNYDKKYFEGEHDKVGYKNYLEQQQWRIEKAEKLLNIVKPYLSSKTQMLDIGASYGFTRKAAEDLNFEHYGHEISEYANKVCNNIFGFTNYNSKLNLIKKKFNLITIFDVIEHIFDVDNFIKDIKCLLKMNGYIFIRTPNIDSIEFKVLGNKFYSLKAEHLNYFSPLSLSYYLKQNNFEIIYLNTTSHFFRGFIDIDFDIFEKNLMGSDILCIGRLNE